MAKIIPFKIERTEAYRRAEELLKVGGEIDDIILKHLKRGMDSKELVGILAHRLGNLLGHLDEKDELWYVCRKVLEKQADIG
jgi:hypothetical protein